MQLDNQQSFLDLVLASMYRIPVPGIRSSFMYGKPGSADRDKRFGFTVYFSEKDLVRASVFLRKSGPVYLKYLSMTDVGILITAFVKENFGSITEGGLFAAHFSSSYAEVVSENTKAVLLTALARSSILQPASHLTLYPLVPITVGADFDSEPFFLIRPASLDATRIPAKFTPTEIAPAQFPPMAYWEYRKETPTSWLGVRSPALQASSKMKAAVLGALALTQPLPQRTLFSGRAMFGGRCTLGDGFVTSFGAPHTPPLMDNVVIGEGDRAWLTQLATKLPDNQKSVRRQLRALEYFYKAWPLSESNRFPLLCMALDAAFGEAGRAAQAVIDGVRGVIGTHVSDARLRTLLTLRAAVIHGGAPDVYDSSIYLEYYDDYATNPICDLELVVAQCLREKIFAGTLLEHRSEQAPHHEQTHRARKTILDPEDP
jgi:hypothetical protein